MEQNQIAAEEKYPVDVTISYPERSSRLLAVCTILFFIPKLVVLIPHFIILYFLGIFSLIAGFFAQIAVLFTGRYPKGIFEMVEGVYRWQMRLNAYLFGLADKYPPFQLKS